MKLNFNLKSILLTLFLSALISLPNVAVYGNTNCEYIKNENQYENSINEDESIITFAKNNTTLSLSDDDVYLMSQIVYAESKGEPFEGKVAVASVILNRALSPQFPSTVKEVIFQPKAFSCVINGSINVEPTQECFDAVYQALNTETSHVEALFFYNPEIATCTWMSNVEKADITPIGNHVFFNLD